jgi:hypothetical protein
MPGISSGLDPKILALHSDLSATTVVPVCKFPSIHTMLDAFWIFQTAMTTNTSTTHARVRVIDGATTGSGTANAGLRSGTWVAYTGATIGTNYTFAANDWALCRYSEAGTVALGTWAQVIHCVNGNV